MKPQNYVAVLAVLNAMLTRVSSSLPQIDQATRGLWTEEVSAEGGAVVNGSEKAVL